MSQRLWKLRKLRTWHWLPAIVMLSVLAQAWIAFELSAGPLSRGVGSDRTFVDEQRGYRWTSCHEIGGRFIWVQTERIARDDTPRQDIPAVIAGVVDRIEREAGFVDHSVTFKASGFPLAWYFSACRSADHRGVREADAKAGIAGLPWPRNGAWKRGVCINVISLAVNVLISTLVVLAGCVGLECRRLQRAEAVNDECPGGSTS